MKATERSDSQIRDAYTQASSTYDEKRFVPRVEDYVVSALVELTGAKEGTHVLDVAAGTGRTAIPLAKTGATVVALDITPAMIERMRCKADGLGLKNLEIERANARQMPFRAGTRQRGRIFQGQSEKGVRRSKISSQRSGDCGNGNGSR